MKPRDIAGALQRRYWMVIAIVLVAALTGAIVSVVQTPVYKVRIIMAAEAPINPMTKNPDATITFGLAYSMQAIANAAQSIDVARATSAKLKEAGINISPEELQERVTADFEVNTTSLNLDFTDSSPTRAAEIANAWGEETSRILGSSGLMLGGKLALTNKAVPPNKPTAPNPMAYVSIGAFLGLVLGITLVLGLEYFDPHFRSSEETREMLGLPVLGVLPREKAPTELSRKVYANIRTNIVLSDDNDEYRSILVASVMPDFEEAQANTGAKVTINLAMAMARSGRNTVIVDCNFVDKSASQLLGAGELPGLAEVLEGKEPSEGFYFKTSVENLSIVPAGSSSVMPSDLLSSPLFTDVVRRCENDFEAVFLDGPPLIENMDSAIAANSTTSSLIVIDVRNCTRNGALKALEGFYRFDIKPTGVILTNFALKHL
jgi:receptor protein-tyrosine kinase